MRDGFVYRLMKDYIYKKNNGIYVLNENWNHLIILDACRFDVFESAYKQGLVHKGKLEYRISRGFNTMSFLTENFKEKSFFDNIIYITANPFVDRYLSDKLFKIIPVWRYRWDDKENTVLPSSVFEETVKAYLKYGSSKRYIVHFIQPHYPYIGSDINDSSLDIARESIINGTSKELIRNHKKKLGKIYETDIYASFPIKSQIEAYQKNLKLSLQYANKLSDFFLGMTIMTADHGESFGEWIHPLIPIKFYGHGKYVRSKVIVKVPWHIIEEDTKDPNERKKIHKEFLNKKIRNFLLTERMSEDSNPMRSRHSQGF